MYTKDTLLYEHFQYGPMVHEEAKVKKRLAERFGEAKPSGLVDDTTFLGIEVEVERMTMEVIEGGFATGELHPVWSVKKDGSLRNNGYEFVTLPVRGANVKGALDLLNDHLHTHHKKHEFSERCSVHVHVNVRKLSIEQVIAFIVVYMSVEKSIFKFIRNCGWDRSNNIFCVAVCESDFYVGLHNLLRPDAEQADNALNVIQNFWRKYTAFNTLPIKAQGTFEFRHMGGTIEVAALMNWINIILSLKKFVEKTKLDDILKTIADLNVNSQYEAYLHDIFGEYTDLLGGQNIQAELEPGVCSVKDMLIFAQSHEEFPKTLDELQTSTSYKFLAKKYNMTLIKTDVAALQKELDKLITECRVLDQKYNNATTVDESKTYHALYVKMSTRINEIEVLLNKTGSAVRRVSPKKQKVIIDFEAQPDGPPEFEENFIEPHHEENEQ